jgi:hypothetical protein
MMPADLLVDAFGRVRDLVHSVVEGLSPEDLTYRVDEDANTIGWLVWHLTRIQDDHVADVAGAEQAWTEAGWAARFGLPFDQADTGYGHGRDEVAAVRVASGDLLTGYYDDVHTRTVAYLGGVSDEDWSRIVDERWDPPVTLAVRLVSVVSDDLQHVGQAAYVRGLLLRR